MTVGRFSFEVRRADLLRLGASLILALVLWGAVVASQDPKRSRTFAGVAVTTPKLPGALQVVASLPPVSVQVKGPSSRVDRLVSTDVTATLDVRNVTTAGSYSLPVVADAPGGMWSTSADPGRVSVVVEEVIARQFPVTVEVGPTTGSSRQVGSTTPSVSEVTVRGPASAVNRVAKVSLPVTISDQGRDFTGVYDPVAKDSAGQAISEVAISPASITVDVQITARGKSLAVIALLQGEPAQGYDVVDRTFNPPTVVVDGPADVIASLISVSTEQIDISNATATLQKRVKLVGLPDGVRVVEPADAAVDIVVQIRQQGVRQVVPAQTVETTNLGAGLSVNVAPSNVSVTIIASETTLRQLRSSDLVLQVDLAGLDAGAYDLSPSIALPPNVSWISTEPTSVRVTIHRIEPNPASTPTASPVASPRST